MASKIIHFTVQAAQYPPGVTIWSVLHPAGYCVAHAGDEEFAHWEAEYAEAIAMEIAKRLGLTPEQYVKYAKEAYEEALGDRG